MASDLLASILFSGGKKESRQSDYAVLRERKGGLVLWFRILFSRRCEGAVFGVDLSLIQSFFKRSRILFIFLILFIFFSPRRKPRGCWVSAFQRLALDGTSVS